MTQDAKVVETLTREQVDAWRNWIKARHYPHAWKADTLCDMALLSLEYSERITKMEGALRELVRLKDLKERNTFHTESGGHLSWDGWLFDADKADYDKNQPLAWDAARSALPEEPK
jgi:hypothetical protein